MDEQVIAKRDAIFHRFDESQHVGRHGVAQHFLRFFHGRSGESGRIDAEAEDRFLAAVAQEMAQHFQIIAPAQEHFLVIATQDAHGALLLPRTGRAQDAGTVRPPINQIAQQDHQHPWTSPTA